MFFSKFVPFPLETQPLKTKTTKKNTTRTKTKHKLKTSKTKRAERIENIDMFKNTLLKTSKTKSMGYLQYSRTHVKNKQN